MIAAANGTMVRTVSGRQIDFASPFFSDITIEDIAHGLAGANRFAGHTEPKVYTVAQHSVLCSYYCRSHPLEALLHDASESYMGDCPAPLKDMLGDAWRSIENRLMDAIYMEFGLEPGIPPAVKDVDYRMYLTERRDLQPSSPPIKTRRRAYLWKVEPWSRMRAKRKFLARFKELTK